MMSNKYVYLFDEGNTNMKVFLGGKGANQAKMTNIDLSISPGITVTIKSCNNYASVGDLPESLSEAKFTKTGIMDSILNLGLNDQTFNAMVNHSIFIGHGRNKIWMQVKLFLQDELGLTTVGYESESRVGESIISVLEKMLEQSIFAVLVLTAEDETAEGTKRVRQNVIHESGLFQGKLGFRKVVLLKQKGIEDFTNVDGLQYISFNGDQIEQTFHELIRVLKREGILD
ncbi:MAG: TIR domain-containing protein [Eubacteriales bacterium]